MEILRAEPRKIVNCVVGIILMTPAIISFLNSTFGILSSLSSILISLVLIILLILYFLTKPKVRLSKIAVITGVLLLVFFIVSKIIFPDMQYTVFQLAFYVLLPFFVSQQDFNYKDVLSIVIIISIPLVFSIENMLALENVGLNQADMYATYSFVPSIIAAFIYIAFFIRKKKITKGRAIIIIGCILNVYYCVRVAQTAVRGYWLILISYVLLLLILYLQKKLRKKIYYIVLSLLTFVAILVIFNFKNIIELMTQSIDDDGASSAGILLKMKRLLSRGDLLNGRAKIWGKSTEYILGSPVFGNGMESMNRLSDGLYPYSHNFILQLLQDCGVAALFLIYAVFYEIYILFKYGYSRSKIILLYLVTLTVPMMLLSGDVWKSAPLWILIGYGTEMVRRRYGKNEN